MSYKKPANTKRNVQKKRTLKKRAKGREIRRDIKLIAGLTEKALNASTPKERIDAGALLTKKIGNEKAMPVIAKMLMTDPEPEVRRMASDFFMLIASKKRTKQAVQKSIQVLQQAERKEKHNITRLYIQSNIKILESILNPPKKQTTIFTSIKPNETLSAGITKDGQLTGKYHIKKE